MCVCFWMKALKTWCLQSHSSISILQLADSCINPIVHINTTTIAVWMYFWQLLNQITCYIIANSLLSNFLKNIHTIHNKACMNFMYRQIKNLQLQHKNIGFSDGWTQKNLGFSFGFGYRNNTIKLSRVIVYTIVIQHLWCIVCIMKRGAFQVSGEPAVKHCLLQGFDAVGCSQITSTTLAWPSPLWAMIMTYLQAKVQSQWSVSSKSGVQTGGQ